jgi:hypothetical protein
MVEFITYKKEKHPIRLSYRVFKGMKAEMGDVDLDKLQSLDTAVMETMLWHGLISGYKSEDKVMPFTREEMEDILDECFYEFLKLIPLFFPKAKVNESQLGNALPNLENQKEPQEPSPTTT